MRQRIVIHLNVSASPLLWIISLGQTYHGGMCAKTKWSRQPHNILTYMVNFGGTTLLSVLTTSAPGE